MGLRVRELIRQVCEAEEVRTSKRHVSRDHVHLLVSIPPQVTISRLVQRLEGRSSHNLMMELARVREPFWGRHIWARGYFSSSGWVTDEVIKAHIEHQDQEQEGGDSHVEGEPAAERRATPSTSALQPGTSAGFSRNRDFQSQPKPPRQGGGPSAVSRGRGLPGLVDQRAQQRGGVHFERGAARDRLAADDPRAHGAQGVTQRREAAPPALRPRYGRGDRDHLALELARADHPVDRVLERAGQAVAVLR